MFSSLSGASLIFLNFAIFKYSLDKFRERILHRKLLRTIPSKLAVILTMNSNSTCILFNCLLAAAVCHPFLINQPTNQCLLRTLPLAVQWVDYIRQQWCECDASRLSIILYHGSPPQTQLGDLGEHCKLPQRGPGQSPAKAYVVYFEDVGNR